MQIARSSRTSFGPKCKKIYISIPYLLLAAMFGVTSDLCGQQGVGSEAPAVADQPGTGDRGEPRLTIPLLTGVTAAADLLLGGVDPRLARVEHFRQRTPDSGAEPSHPFTAYLGYDARALYLIFEARDAEPGQVRANLSKRDNIAGDDAVRVYLDTFLDRQRAYVFRVNPLGVQFDAIWSEASGWDTSYDTVWQSGGELTPWGYRAWMAIPWRSLRFPRRDAGQEHRFGLIVGRELSRASGEEVYWPFISEDVDGWLPQAGTLGGMRDISPGRNLQLVPYVTGRSFELLESGDLGSPRQTRSSDDGEIGLDAKLVVRDSYVLDLALNPDFSQVESDAPQITVNQRFEVFFPERRPFFLENADVFRTPFTLFFSRRIVDPELGARVTGKSGRYSFGALLADDEAPGKIAETGSELAGVDAEVGVLRLTRDVGSDSRVGLLAVERRLADSDNRVTAVDGRFRLGRRWALQTQLATSDSRSLAGESSRDHAFWLSASRQGRRLSYSGNVQEIGDDFQADAGFVTRTGFRSTSQFASYWIWPEDSPIIFWGPEAWVLRRWDLDGTLVDEFTEVSLEWHFANQTFVELNLGTGGTVLRPDEFPLLPRDRRYLRNQIFLELGRSFSRRLQAQANLGYSRDVNFAPAAGLAPQPVDILTGNVAVQLRLLRRLSLDLDWLFTDVETLEGGRAFANHILRGRANWQFTRALSLRAIVQWDCLSAAADRTRLEPSRNLNGDLLFTWRLDPWTALFLGYNSNYRELDDLQQMTGRGFPARSLERDSQQLFLKLSYRLPL